MKKMGVIIVDDSPEVCESLKKELSSVTEYDIIETITDPSIAATEIIRLKPDILLLDMFMPALDGDDVLESLRGKLNSKMGIIVLCPFCSDMAMSHYASLGAHYFIEKPVNTAKLLKKICLLCESLQHNSKMNTNAPPIEANATSKALKSNITKILLKTGISPKLKGFCFIRESISFICTSGNELTSVTKIVYPKIADEYGTESEKVERAIRTAIEKAFSIEEGGSFYYETLCASFAGKALKPYPSNREFIFTVAEYIKSVEPAV